MRFDDRLETTLRQADDDGIGLYAKWQQLVDMLAQNSSDFDPVAVVSGLQKVRQLMDIIPATLREQCVRGLSGRLRSAPLMLLLSGDVPAVAAAAVRGARLSDAEWADIVPHMSTRAREYLRNRGDIGPMTLRALRLLSSADYAPACDKSEAEMVAPAPQVLQIRDIVERIEKLRIAREQHDPAEIQTEVSIEQPVSFAEPIDQIRFETDQHGTISWIEGAPAGAVNRLVLTLPKKLTDMDESELFGSGPLDDSHDAPLLGLGFSLRLVRSLSRNVVGDLRFYNEALIVSLPAVHDGLTGLKDEEG